jgi:hypothetical protein
VTTDEPQSPAAGPSRQARVRALRERVEREPDRRLVASRAEVLGLLAPAGVNGEAAPEDEGEDRHDTPRYAQSLLAQHGIRAVPPLTEEVADVTLTTSRSYAIQGALVVTAGATVLGLIGYWLYGVLFAVVGLVTTAGIALGFDSLRGALPAALPRGRLLGAAIAVAAALLVFVAAVLPIRHHRNAVGRARGLVVQADALVNAGQFVQAQDKLFAAEDLVGHPPLIDDVRGHLNEAKVESLLRTQALQQAIYDRAERAFERGDARAAIRLATRIRGYADVDQRLREYRRAERRTASGG